MDVKEAVVSNEEMTVSGTQARFSWQVDFAGQFQTGVEVSQSENMADLRRVEASKEEDRFVAVVDSLTEGKKYYYRIVVWNKFGSYEEMVKDFTTAKTFSIHVEASEGGTAIGGGTFAEGDTCTVVATANVGYNFVNWTENDIPVDTNSVYSFAVNSDRELVANFREEDAVLYTVITKAEPVEGGIVTGGGNYLEGREIELKATANTGYTFIHWDDGSTDNPRRVTVTADVTYTAYFNHDEYEIKVECQPENGGTATGGGMFHYGDTIALSATPNANFSFAGWSDGSADNPHEVVVTGPVTYKAIFSEAGAVYYHVTTHAQPIEGGEVMGEGTYLEGIQVEMSATPNVDDGYIFEKWDDGNTDNPRTITVNSDMEFTAFFKKKTYTITVQAGTGGTAYIGDMTGTIEATFEHGESCTVHAIPETGYSFVNWTENGTEVSDEENYNFEVTCDHILVATYEALSSLPTVITSEVTNITSNSATGGGSVIDEGGPSVTERGICWSRSHNPTLTSNEGYCSSGMGTGNYTCNITVYYDNTIYYVKAYAKNATGISYGDEVCFTTLFDSFREPSFSDISQSAANISTERIASGNGEIIDWGVCWSTSPNPTISDACIVGNPHVSYYLSGLTSGTTYYFRTYATNTSGTSYSSEKSFTTMHNGGNPPTGAINGLFSVSDNLQVYFSCGNLQYQASTNTWRFGTPQYDYVGESNANISSIYNDWIDLFGWGTSGYNHGANCYQPWSISEASSDYQAYGVYSENLYNRTGQADWGYNVISNGYASNYLWRCLTHDEWRYVFLTRSASMVNGVTNARYAKAKVANVYGIILFPDNYTHPSGVAQPVGINDAGSSGWNGNNYSAVDFASMQDAGAVFLPAAGRRIGTTVYGVGSYGRYWSSSYVNSSYSHDVYFYESELTWSSYGRNTGFSVRLVCPAQQLFNV